MTVTRILRARVGGGDAAVEEIGAEIYAEGRFQEAINELFDPFR